MKRKEFNEMRNKSIKDLTKTIFDKKKEAEKAKMSSFGGKEKNSKIKRNLGQEIAKMLTLIREKEIIESLEKTTEKKEETKKDNK